MYMHQTIILSFPKLPHSRSPLLLFNYSCPLAYATPSSCRTSPVTNLTKRVDPAYHYILHIQRASAMGEALADVPAVTVSLGCMRWLGPVYTLSVEPTSVDMRFS